MKFLFENEQTKEIHAFKDWNDFSNEAGTHWKTIQLKNQNGQSVKCKLGKGKIWRLVYFHKLDPKTKCLMCKDKCIHGLTQLCEKHLKQKIGENSGTHFHEKPGIAYKGQQSGQLFIVFEDKVYRRAQDAHEG